MSAILFNFQVAQVFVLLVPFADDHHISVGYRPVDVDVLVERVDPEFGRWVVHGAALVDYICAFFGDALKSKKKVG